MNHLLSILIPTRNRQYFALRSIKQILSIDSDVIQVVVQDNSDTDLLASMLADYMTNDRLKYGYYPNQLSFVDNFNQAIAHSDGLYVCAIGDDDGINPEIVSLVKWAESHGVEAITTGLQAVYMWPGSGILKDNDDGCLNIYHIDGRVRYYNGHREVRKLLENGCMDYLSFGLAKLYHGIVKRKNLDRIKQKTGYYIGGLSPDIYSSVALSLLTEKIMVINYPITISGMCSNSGSADSVTGKHTGKLEDAPHFKGHQEYEWSIEVPRFYSVETIWADSALAAVREIDKEELKYFSLEVFVANCIFKYGNFSSELKELVKTRFNCKGNLAIKRRILWGYLKGPLCVKVRNVCMNILRNKTFATFHKIDDIGQGQFKLTENLNDSRLSIEKILNQV